MADFIGAGERTVETIAKMLFPQKWNLETQVHIRHLIKKQDFELLAVEHNKHKTDFAINLTHKNLKGLSKDKYIGVIRVQGHDHTSGKSGHQHEHKSKKDSIQKELFQKNKLWVVDILFTECPNIFKEQLNCDSIIEFCEMMKMAGVKLRN